MNQFNAIDDDFSKAVDILVNKINSYGDQKKIDAINYARSKIHDASPFKNQPIDLVLWVNSDSVKANDYNPNKVAPPEAVLLERSIIEDGYTQPIVTHEENGDKVVVDGFHRSSIGKSSSEINRQLHGCLPVTIIRPSATKRESRIASTIRHNRARGSHDVALVVDIVGELVRSGMSDSWILKKLGMDAEELLRMKQISGLSSLFSDKDFSLAWCKNSDDEKFYK